MTHPSNAVSKRPLALCRTWLFAPGLSGIAQNLAMSSEADVIVADLEEFTGVADRPEARQQLPALFAQCRAAGKWAAVRINVLERDGMDDLRAVIVGAPDAVFLPHAESAAQIVALDAALTALESQHGLPAGSTLIVPTLESAIGVVRTLEILAASPRTRACLLAAEDLSANLGLERGSDGVELHALRARFVVECIASGTLPIDCPFNYRDTQAQTADLLWARRIGVKAKCVVYPEQITLANALLTPSEAEVSRAHASVAAFDSGECDPPDYNTARRLLARHDAFERVHGPQA